MGWLPLRWLRRGASPQQSAGATPQKSDAATPPQFDAATPQKSDATAPQLLPAPEAIARYRREGGDPAAAVRGAKQQLAGLRREVDDDARWQRLILMARQIGDPWNADDWPLGFDALLCAIPLCTDVAFECARCPIGQRQEGRSCAHPTSAFGVIGDLVRRADRDGLRTHLDALGRVLEQLGPALA